MNYTIKKKSETSYLVQPVMRNNKSYVMEFETNGACYVRIYEYDPKKTVKTLFCGHKGHLLYISHVTGVPIGESHYIENVCNLTEYGFKKYLPKLIDAAFTDMGKGKYNV